MKGNNGEKEKCMEKLNEMQIFLPFLDFMIDKIKKKNVLPLECQLSKFQHIRSIILEKNRKYSLEGLSNIEDILQKLINKLDYKGIPKKERDAKDLVNVKCEETAPLQDLDIKNENLSVKISRSSCGTSTKTATFGSVSPSILQHNAPAVDMIMGTMRMSVDHCSWQDEKKVGSIDVSSYPTITKGSADRKSSDFQCSDKSVKDLNDGKESNVYDLNEAGTSSLTSDVIASSRKKLLKSVAGKGLVKVDLESQFSKIDRNNSFHCKRDEETCDKLINPKGNEKDILLSDNIFELSDISDEEYIVEDGNVQNTRSDKFDSDDKKNRKSSCEPSSDDFLYYSPISSPLSDTSTKQKLREKLSADIAEVHKVPGKSIGGSLRSLKDLRSQEELGKLNRTKDLCSNKRRKSSKERKGEHLRDSNKKYDHSLKNHTDSTSGKDRKNKDYEDKSRERKKYEKRQTEERDNTATEAKHLNPSKSGRKSGSFREEKDSQLEIDKLNDMELAAFVKENVSSLPHLSKLNPQELRRVLRSSLLPGNLDVEESGEINVEGHRMNCKEIYDKEELNVESTNGKNENNGVINRSSSSTFQKKSDSQVESQSIKEKDGKVNTEEELVGRYSEEDETIWKMIEETTPSANANQCALDSSRETDINSHADCQIQQEKDPRQKHLSTHAENPQLFIENTLSSITTANDKRTQHWRPRPLISPNINLNPSCFPNSYNFDQRLKWNQNASTENLPNRPNLIVNKNRPPTPKFSSYVNVPRSTQNYNNQEPKSYAEYRQMKRQEQEANKTRIFHDYKQGKDFEEGSSDKKVKINQLLGVSKSIDENLKGNDLKKSDFINKINDNRVSISRKGLSSRSISECRKSFEGDKTAGESTEKRVGSRSESRDDELISPLEKLYENDPKPVTGRGCGLQRFKIPKKGKSVVNDNQKIQSEVKDCLNRQSLVAQCRSNSVSEDSNNNQEHVELNLENNGVKKTDDVTLSYETDNNDDLKKGATCGGDVKNSDCEKDNEKISDVSLDVIIKSKSNNYNCNVDDNAKKNTSTNGNFNDNAKSEIRCDEQICNTKTKCVSVTNTIQKSDIGDGFRQENVTCDYIGELDEVRSTINNHNVSNLSTTLESNVSGNQNNSSKYTIKEDKENIEVQGTEGNLCQKSNIKEEITQELVEALIRKSFESGEGELLLAKAKLFKELAMKLNSKKLKTIQKIINSESDSSSSSSDSSTVSEKKKKKKKRSSSEMSGKSLKKTKNDKNLGLDNINSVGSSGEDTNGIGNLRNYNVLEMNEQKDISEVSNSDCKLSKTESVSDSEGASVKKVPKKSQRKTKLLQQIFNESPSQEYFITDISSNIVDKESEQKSKLKGKSRPKTELDRLHEDIRNMFISSGVVTTTGQRMCRMLRESGGKMNNLDIVKESAKMVEEEKLASCKTLKKKPSVCTRSRSGSAERRGFRERSTSSRNPKTGISDSFAIDSKDNNDGRISKIVSLPKNQPVVMLRRINLEKFSYGYRLPGLSCTKMRSRNVAKRGRSIRGVSRPSRDKETFLNKNSKVFLSRNVRKHFQLKNKVLKRKYTSGKLEEIVQKLPLKMASIKHLEMGYKKNPIHVRNRKGVNENKKQISYEGSISAESEMLDYAFDKKRTVFNCLLCSCETKAITSHYKNEHPESEVLISRLSKEEAAIAIQDSKVNNYDFTSLDQACTLEVIKRRVKSKLTGPIKYFCRMCNGSSFTTISQFYSHVSHHTGEYRYKCSFEGCGVTLPSRESFKNHALAKHPKHKSSTIKVMDLLPLPSDRGILFGYLCSLCNFIQVFQRNVENHVQRAHFGINDIKIIKIDLSGKMSEEKKTKKIDKNPARNVSDTEKLDATDEDDGAFDDPNDEDYSCESDDGESNTSVSNFDGYDNCIENDDCDSNYEPPITRRIMGESVKKKGNKNSKKKKVSKCSGVASDNGKLKMKEKSRVNSESKEPMIRNEAHKMKVNTILNRETYSVNEETLHMSGTGEQRVTSDALRMSISEHSENMPRKWVIGPLEAAMLKDGILSYTCNLSDCQFSADQRIALENHITSNHVTEKWNGSCEICNYSIESKVDGSDETSSLILALKHMQDHIIRDSEEYDIPNAKEEFLASENTHSAKKNALGSVVANNEGVPYPKKPLLRVRSLVGDRLSTPKCSSFCEKSLSRTQNTDEKSNNEPLFNIEDVRSLNSESENQAQSNESNFESKEVSGSIFPPNAEVVSGKPILIRSCPSPRITVRSEPNIIPIPVAQAKHAVEAGQLKVIAPPKVSEVASLGINKLEFVTTTSIRILSPGSQAVILPGLKPQPRLLPISKSSDTIQAVTVTQNQKRVANPILNKALLGQSATSNDVSAKKLDIDKSQIEKNVSKNAKPMAVQSSTVLAIPGESPGGSSSNKRQQQYSLSFGGKNIKDVKIYREMLTKRKLCQLFKCMAVECSFTCNNEIIFSQHIGLHEAQQRIKGKKKPDNKLNKIFNWQQCAYCCEVLVHTGSALSQHILTEHGHCLYQCAYCFYRAISETYVKLHQSTVHCLLLKEKKKVIYKCKPIPGAVISKLYEKQIKPSNVRPYHCELCGAKFLIIQDFIDHQTKQHQTVTVYTCHVCKIPYFKPDRLIVHYRLHSYSMYQCAYCLHGTEAPKEMLYHLCNFHFSQPPLMCARMLEDTKSVRPRRVQRDSKKKKTDVIGLDDLKLLTFENESFDSEISDTIIEEVDSEKEHEHDSEDTESVSIDLTSIVSELGISVEDGSKKKSLPLGSVVQDAESHSLSVASMLPNAKFSSDRNEPEKTSVLISSEVITATSKDTKDETDVSVPIGQLPIEVVTRQTDKSSAGVKDLPDSKSDESVDEIIMNLQQNNSSVTLSPVFEKKNLEDAPTRTLHKMPPTVTVSRSCASSAYGPKKMALLKKVEGPMQMKERGTVPVFIKQLVTNSPVATNHISAPSVILTLPVIENSSNSCLIPGNEEPAVMPAIQNVVSLKRQIDKDESSEGITEDSVSSFKKVCLGPDTTTSLITVEAPKESPLLISDVRSLSAAENKNSEILQPPIIRIKDLIDNNNDESSSKVKQDVSLCAVDRQMKTSSDPPSSPDVIILDVEDYSKNTSKELIEVVDSEDDSDSKKNLDKEGDGNLMADNDLEIRKQMEKLRNRMENETDCLLIDDTLEDNACGISRREVKAVDSNVSSFTRSQIMCTKNVNESTPHTDHSMCEAPNSLESLTSNTKSEVDNVNQSVENGNIRIIDPKADKKYENKIDNRNSEKNSAKVETSRMKQELSGINLYLCGNGKCNFSSETDCGLKDHLYVCDLARESSVLVCPHCSKQVKHSGPYVEHLKLHGERKYKCGLCSFSSALETSVTRHLKQKHKCHQTKSLPDETAQSGYFVLYPKNYKKEKRVGEMNVFSPGDEDKLPLQSIYQDNVKCAKCPYFTKVRSNMVRHLKIHIKSVEAEGSIIVPSTAPTNPVPCLDTKEKMFDKMTNLAASSQLAQANREKYDTLSPEEEAKLPQFIPEHMRHKCCSPDCNYLTIDDNMLKHHIKALHDEINVYSCPHCKETVHVEFRFVPLEKIGQHLKYHDTKLYKCCHCMYFHNQKYVVEKHVLEKHPERRFFVYTVREPKVESASASEEEHSSSNESVIKLWKCGLCDNLESPVRSAVLEHLAKVHNTKSKFKCKFCDMKSSQYSAFASHFASKHNGQKVECLRAIIQVNRSCPEGNQALLPQDPATDYFDTTPLWQRDAPRVRHIRGILIEEEEVRTKKSRRITSDIENEIVSPTTLPTNSFYCPLCNDKKKVFQTKSVESFRIHLYQELNYQQYACILCGKMFVDRKDCEKHHSRAHPNRLPAIKQTKEDSEIKFWVNKVIAKQKDQISERKRKDLRETVSETPPFKKKKMSNEQQKEISKNKSSSHRLTRSCISNDLKSDIECVKTRRTTTEDKSDSDKTRTCQRDEKIKKCPHCEYEITDLVTLKTHIKLRHLRMGKWLCPYCDDSFRTDKEAIKHCKVRHPNELIKAIPNSDEKKVELTDDFWFNEYGFGRGKVKPNSGQKGELQEEHQPPTPTDIKPPVNSNIYSCGYCMIEVTDQSSIIEHFETNHKNDQNTQPGVVGTIYYRCNVCSEKLFDLESLNIHAKERHTNKTLQFEIRKLFKYDISESESMAKDDKVDEDSYQCPRCSAICASYLECIEHFNEHFPRYTCGSCSVRFLTTEEMERHQNEYKHMLPYSMTIPSEKMLEEYKTGIRIKRNGSWVSLYDTAQVQTNETSVLRN